MVNALQYLISRCLHLQGHCPLAKGKLLSDPRVLRVASRVNATPAQVLIGWSLQNNVVTIPKSTKADRVAENAGSVDVVLDHHDMEILNGMSSDIRVIELNRLQSSIKANKPDGYKLGMFQNSLPTSVMPT